MSTNLFNLFSEMGKDFECVSDDAIIGNGEDRRICILIDCNNRFRA